MSVTIWGRFFNKVAQQYMGEIENLLLGHISFSSGREYYCWPTVWLVSNRLYFFAKHVKQEILPPLVFPGSGLIFTVLFMHLIHSVWVKNGRDYRILMKLTTIPFKDRFNPKNYCLEKLYYAWMKPSKNHLVCKNTNLAHACTKVCHYHFNDGYKFDQTQLKAETRENLPLRPISVNRAENFLLYRFSKVNHLRPKLPKRNNAILTCSNSSTPTSII
jgi:hypothetical protein